jgi:hypothetical protein
MYIYKVLEMLSESYEMKEEVKTENKEEENEIITIFKPSL